MWDITNSIGIIIRKFQGRKKMVLWQSQGKTWEMFITTLSRNHYAHSVCCCYIYKVLSYMMKSDELPLAQWGFHPQFTGENERRVWTGLLWESCHVSCIFSPTLWALRPQRSDPMPKLIQLLQRLPPSVTKCSLQRFSMSLRDSNLPWTVHCKKFIYTILIFDLKSNLPGTAIQYFHCNCYIFLNSYASLKIKWNWNKWLCQLHNP